MRVEITRPAVEYVQLFEGVSQITIVNLVVEFEDLQPPKIANCRVYEDGRTPVISIDPTFWMNASKETREQVTLHELGHCVLGKQHDESKESIMNPSPLADEVYKMKRVKLIEELVR
jgi:Zn-dependent peptidase ImmA (M78 family)